MIKPLQAVYVMHSIKSLAGSFVGIFIPIYLLSLHYPLEDFLFFYLIYSLGVFFFFFLANYLTRVLGLKINLFIALVFQLLFIMLMYILPNHHLPVTLLAIIFSLSAAFYWFPLNVLFALHSDEIQMGGSVGKFFALPKLVTLFAPLLASLLAVTAGFKAVWIVAFSVYFLSLLPLFFIPQFKSEVHFQFEKYLGLLRRYPGYTVAEFFENIREEVEGIILPVFIFLTFRSILSVGIVGTAADIGSSLFALIIGRRSDKTNKKTLLKIGALFMIIAWAIRFLNPPAVIFYGLSLLVGFFEILLLIPFTSIVFSNAKKENPVEFILYREIPVTFARIVVYTLGLILVANIKFTFLLPIIGSIFFLFY